MKNFSIAKYIIPLLFVGAVLIAWRIVDSVLRSKEKGDAEKSAR